MVCLLGTMNSREMGWQRPDLHSSTPSSPPATLCHWGVDHRVHKRWQVNADPPAHDLSFQKESFKSGLIQDSTGCDRQLCCWVLSLPMLQDKALLCSLLQEERKWVLTPSCTVDALQYMDNAESLSRGLTHRPQECSAPNPEHWPPHGSSLFPGPSHCSWESSPGSCPIRHHEQPSEHGLLLLLLQPVEQPPVGGHTPRLNTAPARPPPPTVP